MLKRSTSIFLPDHPKHHRPYELSSPITRILYSIYTAYDRSTITRKHDFLNHTQTHFPKTRTSSLSIHLTCTKNLHSYSNLQLKIFALNQTKYSFTTHPQMNCLITYLYSMLPSYPLVHFRSNPNCYTTNHILVVFPFHLVNCNSQSFILGLALFHIRACLTFA